MSGLTNSPLALRSRRRIIDDAVKGLGSSRGAHLSLRGGRFRLVNANGVETLIDTHSLEIILIDTNEHAARIYFGKQYEPDSDEPPLCWSDNGVGPSTMAMEPQAPTCQMCPNNIRGTKQTFSGKPTTACENRKKMAFIIPDDPAINVYEFQIPPGSLTNFRDYCNFLSAQASGVEGRAMDVADVVTRISFDPDKQFTILFEACALADDDHTMQLIQYIDENHLADVAVGRNDVACDPTQVQALIDQRPARTALAAPQAQPAAQRPALPPRTAAPVQAQEQTQQDPPQAAPPKPPTTRRRNQQTALPPAAPSNGATPAANQSQAAPAANGVGDPAMPSFLRRNKDNTLPADNPPPTPSFGVNRAPPPPAEIAGALEKAMALPTRRG